MTRQPPYSFRIRCNRLLAASFTGGACEQLVDFQTLAVFSIAGTGLGLGSDLLSSQQSEERGCKKKIRPQSLSPPKSLNGRRRRVFQLVLNVVIVGFDIIRELVNAQKSHRLVAC